MVTVLLMNYKRAQNLPIIIDALQKQTIPSKIFLWNNADVDFHDKRLDLIINSSQNLRCWPRWSMAAYADTDYIMTHDDDLVMESEKTLATLIDCHKRHEKPGLAVGFNGVKLGKDQNYYPTSVQKKFRKVGITIGAKHVKYPSKDTAVDVVKGRMILCKTADLQTINLFSDYRENCDDIIVSAQLAKKQLRHHIIAGGLKGKITELPGGKDANALSQNTDWEAYRTKVSKLYFFS